MENHNIRINFLNQHGDFCDCLRCQINNERKVSNINPTFLNGYNNNFYIQFFSNSNPVNNSYDFFGLQPNYSNYLTFSNLNQEQFIHNLFLQSQNELERNEKVQIDVDSELYKNTEKNFTNCTICSDDFNDDDSVSVLNCKHVFHINCINEWGHYNPVCPVCKASIKTQNNENKKRKIDE